MEWNLLLGGEHPHDERLGYAWLEFGRRGEDGAAFCTIGCGMKAVKGRGIAAHWFFVTDQRVGEDLALVDATGVALTADRLEDAIGPRGSVHRRARDYRRAVDERLFGLGDLRYGALIDLLIKIRAPQLSKRPDERGLSAALTGRAAAARPGADRRRRRGVPRAGGGRRAARRDDRGARRPERYLTTYRAYARMATRRRAAPVRQAQTVFDRVSRELAEAEEQHARAQAELRAGAGDAGRASRRADAPRRPAPGAPGRPCGAQRAGAAPGRRGGRAGGPAARGRAEPRSSVWSSAIAELRNRLTEAEAEEAAATSELAAIRSEAADHADRARIAAAVGEVLPRPIPPSYAGAPRR